MLMILLLHICIALASVGFTTFSYFSPSQPKLQITYGLAAATILSGSYLVVISHARILEACLAGLMYTAGVTIGIALTHQKLAAQRTRQ